MAKLYPPIIEEIIPAFYGERGLTIPYSLNRAVGIGDINGFSLLVKSTITNEVLFIVDSSAFPEGKVGLDKAFSGEVTFSLGNNAEKLEAGGFYKVQIAFIDKSDNIGYYSNASVVKYIGKETPILEVKEDEDQSSCFIATYNCQNDITEKMYSYKFTLYDNNGEIVETSGEQLHDASTDVGTEQHEIWKLKRILENDTNFDLIFEVTTINNMKISIHKNITLHKDPEGYAPYGIRLNAKANNEEGYVSLKISSALQNDLRELIYGTFEIFKTSSKDHFKSKYRVASFKLENQDLYEKEFKDFTVESGYTYRYILQQVNEHSIYSEEVYCQEDVEVYYEHLFLYDGNRQLKIAFNPKVSSFKDTILEAKIDTIGSKYPFMFKNNTVKYKEIPISGLISYQMDPENLFMEDYEIWSTIQPDPNGNYHSSQTHKENHWTHNLTDDNIIGERAFKLAVMEWLENGEPKLFKSPAEGNYMIRLMNVSLQPVDTVGRMLHSFSATGYEIADADTYSFSNLLEVDREGKYIGYRTTPLYKFPTTKIVVGDEVKNALNIYEIIGNRGLEYVTGFILEDIKPLTQFVVQLERGFELTTMKIRVGATGRYVLDRSLGYHVRSIKLVKEDWNTGDYGFDIINNRGQVTYVFERQALHNNFNDITAIQLAKVYSVPWYSIENKVSINEPVTDINGAPLYRYNTITTSQQAFIEAAVFQELDNKVCFCGIDYEYNEKGQPITKDTKKEILNFSTDIKKIKEAFSTYDINLYGATDPVQKFYRPTILDTTQLSNSEDNIVTISNSENDYHYQLVNLEKVAYSENKQFTNITGTAYAYIFTKELNSQNQVINLGFYKDQQSNVLSEDETSYYRNPFYIQVFENEEPIFIKKDHLTPIYSKDTLIEGSENAFEQSEEILYQNLLPSKYYTQKNVNGVYYKKEERTHLERLDLELIQVFYDEDLENTQNFYQTGNMTLEDVIEDGGYQYTQRTISVSSEDNNDIKNIIGPNFLATEDELYYDPMFLIEHSFIQSHPYIELRSLASFYQTNKPMLDNLYNLNGVFDENINLKELEKKLLSGEIAVYEQKGSGITGGYAYEKIPENEIISRKVFIYDNENNPTDINPGFFINTREQSLRKYLEKTIPHDNEIIIVYLDDLNNPEHIDLTHRFSYSINTSNNPKAFDEISAIYIGKNVRGFATFTQKKYSYNAITEDGQSVELKPVVTKE